MQVLVATVLISLVFGITIGYALFRLYDPIARFLRWLRRELFGIEHVENDPDCIRLILPGMVLLAVILDKVFHHLPTPILLTAIGIYTASAITTIILCDKYLQ